MSESAYTPSAWGQAFHSLKVDEALGAGAAGVGKTLALLMDPLDQVIVEHQRTTDPNHPYAIEPGQSRGWVLHLRRELVELEQTIGESMRIFKAIDPGADYKAATHTWTFSSGLKYQFGHCKDKDDHQKYLGSAFTSINFDELTQFSFEQYEAITARLRSSDPVLGKMLKVRAMSNPGVSPGSRPHWVRELFVDPAPEGKKLIRTKYRMKSGKEFFKTRVYWPGKLTDNPDPEFAERYEQNLQTKAAHIRRAYLDGDWYFSPGAFFGEDFDPTIHVVNFHKIPDDWPVFRSMDWGFKSFGCVHWWALDPDNNMVCFEEFKFKERKDERVAADIKRIEKRLGLWGYNGSRITGPADTQLWEERGDSAKRKIDVFVENGVPWAQADKKSRQDNAEKVLGRLKDHNGGTRLPGLMFMSNCKYIISTLPQIRTSELNPEEPAKGGDDHGMDSVMYACAYASLPERVQVRNVDNGDELDADEEDKPVSRGRWGYGSEVA